MAVEGLIVPEFAMDEHPLLVAKKFQVVMDVSKPEVSDELAAFALDVLQTIQKQHTPSAYSFETENVYVTSDPTDNDGPIYGGVIAGDSLLTGAFDGWHYLRSDLVSALALSVCNASVWRTEELDEYIKENPSLPIHLPVSSVKQIRRFE